MRSGRLRNRADVLKEGQRNEFGEYTDDYELIANIHVEVNVITNTETTGDRVSDNLTTEFKTRYNRRIEQPTPDMFIKFKDNYYDIISVINYRELNKFLTIKAVKRD